MSIGEAAVPETHVMRPTVPGACPFGLAPYSIQPGDTLWELALRSRTTVEIIMRHNPGLDPCNLRKIGRAHV